jgi:hypothetical protein
MRQSSVRPVRLALALTEQALAEQRAEGGPAAEIPQNDPFDGPVLDTDVETMVALTGARVFSRLDAIPHEGFGLEGNSHEEGWFDLDQIDGLISVLGSLIAEAASPMAAPAFGDPRVARWLEAALAFSHEAKRAKRGVCFWL